MNHTLVSIFRNADIGDCTNNGLSSKVNSGYLFWDCTKNEAIMWCTEHNVNPDKQFIIHKRDLWGEDHTYAEPLIKPNGCIQVFGGNFLYTSNSNFYKFDKFEPTIGIVKEHTNRPIPIHDRFESQEEYNELTM